MLVAKNVLSLMVVLGLVALWDSLWSVSLLVGKSNSGHGEPLMTEGVFPFLNTSFLGSAIGVILGAWVISNYCQPCKIPSLRDYTQVNGSCF